MKAAARLLSLLQFSLRNESKLEMPARWKEARKRFLAGNDVSMRNKVDELSAVFGDEEIATQYRALLTDVHKPISQRRRALQLLKRIGDRKAGPVYVQLLDDERLRSDAIELIATAADVTAANKLMKTFAVLNEEEKNAALNALTSRPDFAVVLLQAVEGGTFDKKQMSSLQIRQMNNLRNKEVNQYLEKVWGKVGDSSSDSAAAILRLKKAYTTAPLWAYDHRRGRQVYEPHLRQLPSARWIHDASRAEPSWLLAKWRRLLYRKHSRPECRGR